MDAALRTSSSAAVDHNPSFSRAGLITICRSCVASRLIEVQPGGGVRYWSRQSRKRSGKLVTAF